MMDKNTEPLKKSETEDLPGSSVGSRTNRFVGWVITNSIIFSLSGVIVAFVTGIAYEAIQWSFEAGRWLFP